VSSVPSQAAEALENLGNPAKGSPVSEPQDTNAAAAAAVTSSPTPDVQLSTATPSIAWILLPIALPVLLAYLWLTRPDDVVTHDTKKFKSSLEIWYQLVMRGDRNTPRNAKRFVNKVRYLAMRQRAYLVPKTVTKGERLLRKWLTGKEEAPAGDGPGQTVPESLLVPLAALHECDPKWIDSKSMFEALEEPGNLSGKVEYSELIKLLINKHQREFGNWERISECRSAFLEMQGEVASH